MKGFFACFLASEKFLLTSLNYSLVSFLNSLLNFFRGELAGITNLKTPRENIHIDLTSIVNMFV